MARGWSKVRSFALWLLLWGGLGLFFASEAAIRQFPGRERSMPWTDALLVNIPFYLLWGLLALGVLRLAGAFPIAGDRRARLRAVAVHLAASLVVAALHLLLSELFFEIIRVWRGRTTPFAEAVAFSFRHNFHVNLLTYWGIVAFRHLRDYDRGLREKELVATRLERQLAHAELQALRMQLQPHFLFNALNSISSLVFENPEAADRMLVRLSDLLRQALESDGQQEIPLGRELDFVGRYLDLERMRYSDRLEVTTRVEPGVEDAAVPAFVLQPLVENAIVHGVGRSAEPVEVTLSARRAGDELVLEVCNGLPAAAAAPGAGAPAGGAGVGLHNTRARLEQLYGARGRLELEVQPGRRAVARVLVPFRELEPAPFVS
ncbi:MAG: hypothetical protein H6Q03_692 [Acidobacteria bacterium]|nr:hypothetical protein [Acidobacteriota bacterium]